MKRNNNEHFLENKHAQMIPRQHPGTNFPINHRMPQHQQHQTGRNLYIANHRQPPYQQQSINQPPQVPQDHMSSNFYIACHREPHYQQQSLNQPTQVPQDQLIRMI